MTVEEMLQKMSASEFFTWAAFYKTKGMRFPQSPDQIKANLAAALGARRKKK